jgi:outer membrane protein OmpA-like peptidoglycan-associated protein
MSGFRGSSTSLCSGLRMSANPITEGDDKITTIAGFTAGPRFKVPAAGDHVTFYAAGPFVQAAPPPPPPPAKKKIVLRSVYFDFNKSNIRPDARPVLDEAARTFKEEGGIAVLCAGDTDSVGSDAYNMKLSLRRANSVRDYLVNHGIAPSRIRTEGFGESRPVASNDTADGRAQNRRVELNVE